MAVTAGMIPIIWLVILAVLVVIEIITLGLTTIWFAGGDSEIARFLFWVVLYGFRSCCFSGFQWYC